MDNKQSQKGVHSHDLALKPSFQALDQWYLFEIALKCLTSGFGCFLSKKNPRITRIFSVERLLMLWNRRF